MESLRALKAKKLTVGLLLVEEESFLGRIFHMLIDQIVSQHFPIYRKRMRTLEIISLQQPLSLSLPHHRHHLLRIPSLDQYTLLHFSFLVFAPADHETHFSFIQQKQCLVIPRREEKAL